MKPETTEQALLTHILEHPDDDAPRLIYADWLDEHGQPERAEFIRLQCEGAKHSLGLHRDKNARKREQYLRRTHATTWASDIVGPGVREVRFWRGFVERVTTTAQAFVRHGARWVDKTPLQCLNLYRVAGRAERLAACDHLRNIKTIIMQDKQVGDQDVGAFSESTHLLGLTSLIIGGWVDCIATRVGSQGLRYLGEAPFWRQLRDLAVWSDGSLGTPGVEALAAGPQESQLEDLELGNGCIDNLGAEVLVGVQALRSTANLRLVNHSITDSGLVALLISTSMRGLTDLNLDYNLVTGSGLGTLADSPLAHKLERVSLRGNPIREINLDALGVVMEKNANLCLDLVDCSLPRQLQEEIRLRYPKRIYVGQLNGGKRTTTIN